MDKPLVIELFAGLFGWGDGFVAEGYRSIGFDICKMGPVPQGCELVLQDVLTLHGSQFKDAACIVASPPCQSYSYRAMPWGALWLENSRMDDDGAPAGNYRGKDPILNDLFRACFRIQREASLAAGHYVPMIVENVKGAQPFVGYARWHFGSFYLWGDVPALMPPERSFNVTAAKRHREGQKMPEAHDTFAKDGRRCNKLTDQRYGSDGNKGFAKRFEDTPMARVSSRSNSRKAASAEIAEIPFVLAQHIAKVFKT